MPSSSAANSKTKKGVKRKADTTTPVITTFAGKTTGSESPGQYVIRTEDDSAIRVNDAEQPMSEAGPGKLQSVGRRESSGRMIRPPRSRDLDSGETVRFILT